MARGTQVADIFVSYARADKARVAPLVAALEAQGWSVWWDTEIVGGQEFDALITREIEAASAAIVVWTPASVGSRWVRGEARLAADRGVLAPIQFDAPSLPLDFRAIHTIDLDGWGEDARSQPFQDLLRAVRGLAGGGASGAALAVEAPARPRGVSICVLPFANMSGDVEQEYFADGISEDIITDLSKVSSLAVISRNSAFAFKGQHVDLPQVAKQLNVTHMLEGSVRKAGNRVRITAQLIDGATNDHVWADRYDRDLDDIFALQDEISQAIVSALKLKLFPEEKKAIADRGTTNVEAYDLYLRARALLHQQGPSELRRAIQIFREALALDPEFVPAWRGLHDAHQDAMVYAAESVEEAAAGMTEAAGRVLALTPDAWWSYALRSRQFLRQRQWAEAEAAARTAMTLAPALEFDAVDSYGFVLGSVGRCKEGLGRLEDVRRVDPLSLLVSGGLQAALDFVGRTDEAQAEYERSRDLVGDREIPEHFALFRALGRGDEAAARDLVRRVSACETVLVAGLGDLTAVLDDPEGMLERLRRAQTDPANQDTTRQYKIACWAGCLGDAELSVTALRGFAVDIPGGRYPAIWAPVLSAARGTEGFKSIVRDMGLVDYWRSTGQWGDFAQPVGEDDFECW